MKPSRRKNCHRIAQHLGASELGHTYLYDVSRPPQSGHRCAVTTWITHEEAQRILGVHRSTVGKLIARGKLDSRGYTGIGPDHGCLREDQVRELARQRRLEVKARERRRKSRPPRRAPARPPDDGYDWLSLREAAELLGVTRQTVSNRCRREQMPWTLHDERQWIRRDHVEMLLRARRSEAAAAHSCSGG